MHSFFLGHLGTDATAAASVTAVAIPLAFIACFVLHLPVMVVYVVMCLDEIVKVPFIRWRYNKYIWLKNLTEEKT